MGIRNGNLIQMHLRIMYNLDVKESTWKPRPGERELRKECEQIRLCVPRVLNANKKCIESDSLKENCVCLRAQCGNFRFTRPWWQHPSKPRCTDAFHIGKYFSFTLFVQAKGAKKKKTTDIKHEHIAAQRWNTRSDSTHSTEAKHTHDRIKYDHQYGVNYNQALFSTYERYADNCV